MRTCALMLLAVAVLAVGLSFGLPHFPLLSSQAVIVKSQGPTVERLEQLSHLVASRVYIADVLVGEGEGCRGSWLIKGDALLAVNLAKAKITAKDEETKEANIVLPPPEVLQARVDHERSRTWEVETTTWIPWNADQDKLRDAVMVQAQRLIGHAAGSPENIQAAKMATEGLIRAFYSEVGWQVSVTWEGQKRGEPAG